MKCCVPHKTFHMHILAQHVARGFLAVSITLKHSFHLHSSPTFYSTINQTPLTLSSHGDYTCVEPSSSSFGPVQDSTSATGHEPNLVEDNSMEIKPMFFHKPSMTSTCDTSESIATPPPESDLDYGQSRNMLASPLYLQEQVLTDHYFLTLSEKSQCPSHLMSEKVQGNLPRCSHTEESRVKTQFPTEKAFPQDIKQFVRFSNPTETIEVGS